MDVLILGYSDIVRRRVLPALVEIEGVRKIHIATGRVGLKVDIPVDKQGSIIHGYEAALNECHPCLAYISLPNHLHGYWVKKALLNGFHVVVDKPAFLSELDRDEALLIAKKRNLCLAEAVVWPYHDQISALKGIIQTIGSEIHAIQSIFSIPPMPSTNFRNDPASGGGAFNDLGAYAVSVGRIFFEASPIDLHCRVTTRDPHTKLNTGFVFNTFYDNGKIFQGFFSFGTEYRNSIIILGDKISAELNPVFTAGPTAETNMKMRTSNETSNYVIPGCDMFGVFLKSIFSTLENKKFNHWADILKKDSDIFFMAAQTIKELK